MNLIASGPIGNLLPGLSHSLYCDFTGGDLFVTRMDSPVVQIWVLYTYNTKQESKGFQFLALRRPEDGTYVWLPRGAAQGLNPLANKP